MSQEPQNASEELAQTREQLTLALKTMQELAAILKKMIEEEEKNEKQKMSLIELLIKITNFLLAATIVEITRPESAPKESNSTPGFRSALFSTPKPQEKEIEVGS